MVMESLRSKASVSKEGDSVYIRSSGFDIIVGNPPYVGEKDNKGLFDTVKSTPFGRYFAAPKMDFWYYFAGWTLLNLREGGYFSYIVPHYWTSTEGASSLREFVVKEGHLREFIDFGENPVFIDAEGGRTGVHTCIFVVRKGHQGGFYSTAVTTFGESYDVLHDELAGQKRYISHPSKAMHDVRTSKLLLVDDSTVEALGAFGGPDTLTLSDVVEIRQGIVAGADKVREEDFFDFEKSFPHLKDSVAVGDGIFILSREEVSLMEGDLTPEERAMIKPFLTSKNVRRYIVDSEEERFVIYTDDAFIADPTSRPGIARHLEKYRYFSRRHSERGIYGLTRRREKTIFEGPKILAVRKAAVPAFAYVEGGTYFELSINSLKLKEGAVPGLSLQALTAYLNSTPLKFYLRHMGKIKGGLFQVDGKDLERLPVVYKKEAFEILHLLHSTMVEAIRGNFIEPFEGVGQIELAIDLVVADTIFHGGDVGAARELADYISVKLKLGDLLKGLLEKVGNGVPKDVFTGGS